MLACLFVGGGCGRRRGVTALAPGAPDQSQSSQRPTDGRKESELSECGLRKEERVALSSANPVINSLPLRKAKRSKLVPQGVSGESETNGGQF